MKGFTMDFKKRIIRLANKIKLSSQIEQMFETPEADLLEMLKGDIQNILDENEITEDEFNLEDLRFYGSYTTGKNKSTSDLDVVVQYSGSLREDSAFDLLHSEPLSWTDINGREVAIDINPINSSESGTIDDYFEHISKLEPKS